VIRRAIAVVCSVSLAAAMVACTPATPAAPRERLAVAVTHRPFGALFPIARDEGFFAAHGLEVDVRPYETGKAALEDVIAGRIDVGMGPDFTYATASMTSDRFRILSQVASGVDHQVVVLKDGGLTGPRDLGGKRVGVRAGTSQFAFMLYLLLAASGVPNNSVTVVSVPDSQTAEALLSHKVDAIVTWAPLLPGDARALESRVETWSMESVASTWSLIAVSPETLAKRRRAVESLLAALVDAQHWAERNPRRALAIARTWSGQPDAYPAGWPAESIFVELSQASVVRLDEEVRWIERTTGARAKAPIEDLIAPGPLEAVDPALVTVTGQ
jgi:ABC-type nitrate/sulfonate/bicarbonate transport system substrate-binding protein